MTFGPAGTAAYSAVFPSPSAGGRAVKLIVLDTSRGEVGTGQREWLEQELPGRGLSAKELEATDSVPVAIVMGGDALGFELPQGPAVEEAKDAQAVSRVLIQDHASAYVFDYPSSNVQTEISESANPAESKVARKIPAYGTGTLGYVELPGLFEQDSLGSSGILLLNVNTATLKEGYAPVTAEAVPNIGQLALNATNGTLLHRSEVGLFEGLARRPQAGVRIGAANGKGGGQVIPDVYDPIPFDCQGANCGAEVTTQYRFRSSQPDLGGFVLHESSSGNPRQVEQLQTGTCLRGTEGRRWRDRRTRRRGDQHQRRTDPT